jgi:hypothetical protein
MRLITALMLVVVFASGVIVGFAADTQLDARHAEAVEADESGTREGRRVPMYEQVGPNESQMTSIDSIVRHHREAMGKLHRDFREAYTPRYEALIEETRVAIKGVLDPAQVMAYDSLIAERDQRRAEERGRRDEDRD